MIEQILNDKLMHNILGQPAWLVAWVGWLMVVNTLSVVFVKHVAARWVLAAWIGNALTMTLLHIEFGFTRILGLSHVIWWTPLLIYLWRTGAWRPLTGAARYWVLALLLTNAASLVIDYVDVIRYFTGDGALPLPPLP